MNFDTLTTEQIGKLFPIRIEPYNPNWETFFEQEKVLILNLLDELVVNIEHIGSTSVAGLPAKPAIDILVEVLQLNDEIKQIITKKMKVLGYENMQNSEKKNSMTFGKGYDTDSVGAQTYHTHFREKGEMPQDEVFFRDYLRQHPDTRDEYAKLKYTLAKKYQFNREEYTQGKSEFITSTKG